MSVLGIGVDGVLEPDSAGKSMGAGIDGGTLGIPTSSSGIGIDGETVGLPVASIGPVDDRFVTGTTTGHGPTFDHEVVAAPTTSLGALADAFVSAVAGGVGPVLDHEVVSTAPTFSGPVSDIFTLLPIFDKQGPIFDHVVQEIPMVDWSTGPIFDTTPVPSGLSASGPVSDESRTLPPFLVITDPDAVVPAEVRNRLEPELVEIKSPGTYKLERSPVTGRVIGFKF